MAHDTTEAMTKISIIICTGKLALRINEVTDMEVSEVSIGGIAINYPEQKEINYEYQPEWVPV